MYRKQEGMKTQEDYPVAEDSGYRKTARLLYFFA